MRIETAVIPHPKIDAHVIADKGQLERGVGRGSLFGDTAVFHNTNHIRITNGTEAMGDDN